MKNAFSFGVHPNSALIIKLFTTRGPTGMSIVTDLLARPGVIAAGEYAYRGDRFSYRGALSEEHARMASIMCRATTMGANMEGRMLEVFQPRSGLFPPRGWVVHGPDYTVCVMANVFCMLDNAKGSINDMIDFMTQTLAKVSSDLI
jgi:roadblock/LC7 domain-containing protein